LGRFVVLEGIETEQHAAWLKEIGCDYGQGFYFAGALSRQQVPDFIAARRATDSFLVPEQVSGMTGVGRQT
jgi:EAL domain-containing protein (putative c-di-GMP-specific phosphodiesterase class I)